MELSNSDRERLRESNSLNVGGPPRDSEATLCIYSDNLDPNAISALIGCDPTRARRKGESDPRRPRTPPAPVGQWFLEAPVHLPFAQKLKHLLAATTGNSDAWRELRQEHAYFVRSAIFLRSWTEEFWLDPDTLTEMASRQWGLALSKYSAEGEEILAAFLTDPKRAEGEPEA